MITKYGGHPLVMFQFSHFVFLALFLVNCQPGLPMSKLELRHKKQIK